MPGSRSKNRSRSRSRSGTRRRLGARRSPLGMRRTYRRPSVDKSASKWRKRGLAYPMSSRSRKSWAQKAIKDAFRNRKSRMAKKRLAMMATSRGSMAGLPLELRNKIRNMTKRGGYKYKRSRSHSQNNSKKKSKGSAKGNTRRGSTHRGFTRRGSRRS